MLYNKYDEGTPATVAPCGLLRNNREFEQAVISFCFYFRLVKQAAKITIKTTTAKIASVVYAHLSPCLTPNKYFPIKLVSFVSSPDRIRPMFSICLTNTLAPATAQIINAGTLPK